MQLVSVDRRGKRCRLRLRLSLVSLNLRNHFRIQTDLQQ